MNEETQTEGTATETPPTETTESGSLADVIAEVKEEHAKEIATLTEAHENEIKEYKKVIKQLTLGKAKEADTDPLIDDINARRARRAKW